MLWLGKAVRHPGMLLSLYGGINQWARRSIVTVTMQDLDNSLTLYPKRGRLGGWTVTSRQGEGAPNPTSIRASDEVLERLAAKIDGFTANGVGEIFNIPMTAHFLGGCTIGDAPGTGVIDPYHRVYGYPGLHIVDGSTVTANLGVNPSLTITALAERAMSFWPNNGDEDPRPPLTDDYCRLDPVAPRSPTVPPAAPAALRLSIAPGATGPEPEVRP